MDYGKKIVCFIDILGFKSEIDKTVRPDGDSDTNKILKISDIFSVIRHSLDIQNPNEFSLSKRVTQFSDCVVISFDYSEKGEVYYTISDIQNMLINLTFKGFICRGAIVIGKLIHTEEMIFGPALVDAYTLESKSANYPRIIIDNSVIENAKLHPEVNNLPKHEIQHIHERLDKDSDGFFFVDYVKTIQSELDDPENEYPIYLDKISKILESGLNNKRPDIRAKYSWLKEKYMQVVQHIKTELNKKEYITEIDECYLNLRTFD